MPTEVQSFLARYQMAVQETTFWGQGSEQLELVRTCYLSGDLPPLDYVTSVRGVVFHNDQVLVMHNSDETHLLPGGRREQGENLEDTLRRELLEETGWHIVPGALLGFMHFHHLNARPAGHVYPYPDFVQVVYLATASSYSPEDRLTDDYEVEATFMSVEAVRDLNVSMAQLVYLAAALAARDSP